MTLTDDQIKSYIQKPQNDEIADFVKEHEKLNMFATGKGMETYINRIQGIETTDKAKLRRNFARSTKDVVEKILRPTDKVYSAKGGSFEVQISNKTQKKEFAKTLSNISEGMSKRLWLETYALDAYHTDPNALIFVERPSSNSPETDPYPTYKSITTIHDYMIHGQDVEYVIFRGQVIELKNQNSIKVFRVVDDEKDGLYYLDANDTLQIYFEGSEPGLIFNSYEKVPALVISNLIDKNSGGKKSMLEPITELLAEYLQDTSVKSIYKFLHGYPLFWRFIADCKSCKGTGIVSDKEGNTNDCGVCDGTGKNMKKDISDTFDLAIPLDTDDAILDVAKTPAGYVEPSVESWKQMTEEQIFMIDIMVKSYWGTSLDDRYDRETAQGRTIDTMPIADKLNKYADWAEVVDRKVTDIVGAMKYGSNYGGSFVFYGRRFLIESSDQIWRKLTAAIKDGAPEAALIQILIQYYHSEYQNDIVMLDKAVKLLKIEPYPFWSFEKLNNVATNSQKQRKLAFSEWSRTEFDPEKEVEVLMVEFDTFAKSKTEKEEVPEPPAPNPSINPNLLN